MKTNKDAYIALVILSGFSIVTALLIGSLPNSSSQPHMFGLLQLFLYYLVFFTPGIILDKYTSESRSHFQKLRQSTRAFTGAAGLMALLRFPQEGVTIAKYMLEVFIFLLVLMVFLSILIRNLLPFLSKKKLIIAFTKVCSIRISVAFLIAALIYHTNDLTSTQLLAVFLVFLGIYTNQIQPGNVKINAIKKQGTQLAKQTTTLFECLSISAGLAILMAFAQSTEDQSVSNLLTSFFIILIVTWIVALVRNGLALRRH